MNTSTTMTTTTTPETSPLTTDILPATCDVYDAARLAAQALDRQHERGFSERQEERDALFAAIVPTVGMPATINHYSDRSAATVVAVSKSGRTITVREDHAKLLNAANSGEADALEFSPGGFCGHTSGRQRYAYRTNEGGKLTQFSRRETTYRGRVFVKWVRVGDKRNGTTLTLGIRAHHYDFNF